MVCMFRELADCMTGALFVPDATGFSAAVSRSAMGIFLLVTGNRDRVRVSSTLHEGSFWLAEKLVGGADAEVFAQLLEAKVQSFCQSEAY